MAKTVQREPTRKELIKKSLEIRNVSRICLVVHNETLARIDKTAERYTLSRGRVIDLWIDGKLEIAKETS